MKTVLFEILCDIIFRQHSLFMPKTRILYLYCDERRDIRWYISLARGKSQGQIPRDFLSAYAIFHRISWLESQYRHSQLQFQYCPCWESNIERVDSPYFSNSWGYIFQYNPSSTGSVLENIAPARLGVYLADPGQARGCAPNSLMIN